MASHLIYSKLLNCGVPSLRSVGLLYLRTTVPRRLGQLCLQTTTSRLGCISSPRFTGDGVMVININSVCEEISREIMVEVSNMKKSIGVVPGLAVIQVGKKELLDPSNWVFHGMKSFKVRLAEDSSEEKVLNSVSSFNNDPSFHGILVNSPLPSHMDKQKILNAISIDKEVTGFHPQNIGRLAMQGIEPLCVPFAPKACMELLRRYNLETNGKRAVVLGSSCHFSMSAALLLEREGATVTIIHSKTMNPEELTRQADIIISDVREQNRRNWIKPGAVIVNIGFPLTYQNYKVASAMTLGDRYGIDLKRLITMMGLSNVLALAKRSHNLI